ncbi:hypothetical protein L484_022934 [Morus notabilis]|uniref:Pentatricopeptide repeat-containing protein n=1 Tax=Morus notabilis TaxID=981085 RepID=W9R3Y2_9ROSA|nr:hypothetical protein L484_022934 [Morus notabilis]
MGIAIHALVVKLGLSEELMVSNALMDMYAKCGYLSDAVFLFGKNNNRNVVTWNSMIGGFSREGDVSGTFDLLRRMQMEEDENVKVNEVTILNVLPACLEEDELVSLKEIHGYSFKHGFHDDELVANAFVSAYTKCGSLHYAQHVFFGIEKKTVSSFNALIGRLAQNGDPRMALDFYFEMKDSGLDPDLKREVEQGRDGVLFHPGITAPEERNQSRKAPDLPTNARSLSFAVTADEDDCCDAFSMG